MSAAKVTISIDESLLKKVDHLVKTRVFHSRSQAIQLAIQEKVTRIDKTRLARECSKLDKSFEQSLANEGLETEIDEGPEY